MTPKQEKFCQEYMIDLNATQAAIRAGYSVKYANTNVTKLLQNTTIAKRIEELKKETEKESKVNLQMVLDELARIAFMDLRKLYDENGELKKITDLDDDTARALSGVEITVERAYSDGDKKPDYTKKFRTVDKKGALELLGKHFGAFTDKVEHSGGIQVIKDDLGII